MAGNAFPGLWTDNSDPNAQTYQFTLAPTTTTFAWPRGSWWTWRATPSPVWGRTTRTRTRRPTSSPRSEHALGRGLLFSADRVGIRPVVAGCRLRDCEARFP